MGVPGTVHLLGLQRKSTMPVGSWRGYSANNAQLGNMLLIDADRNKRFAMLTLSTAFSFPWRKFIFPSQNTTVHAADTAI